MPKTALLRVCGFKSSRGTTNMDVAQEKEKKKSVEKSVADLTKMFDIMGRATLENLKYTRLDIVGCYARFLMVFLVAIGITWQCTSPL